MCQIFALVQPLFSPPTTEKGAYSGSEYFLSRDGTWSNKAKLPEQLEGSYSRVGMSEVVQRLRLAPGPEHVTGW